MRKLYQKLFASVYDPVMSSTEKVFEVNRTMLLSNLEGTILDVGAGTGVNFRFFKQASRIIAIEPSAPMLEKAKSKITDDSIIETYNLGVNDQTLENIIEDGTIDNIVCTLVLCTIPDPELSLQKFKRWLKPDGRLIILEHIRSKKHIHGKLQDWANPIWKVVGEGCNLNRNTDLLIKDAGFTPVSDVYFEQSMTFYQGIFKK
jgi:ubiquinone/menaquinone biosynthesis C-methylase UbiE